MGYDSTHETGEAVDLSGTPRLGLGEEFHPTRQGNREEQGPVGAHIGRELGG
jgi:hypothetical protein